MTYVSWAFRAFQERIAPVLAEMCTQVPNAAWLSSCGPGEGEQSRYRLFPGSLHLLWIEAIGREPSDADRYVAAALECLHNASLHHDDVLDGHDSRRGVMTIHGREGASEALLAGDGLIGLALRLLAANCDSPVVRHRIATAWLHMTNGQWMDEPASWRDVIPSERETYWQSMCRMKLALGNVAAPIAAIPAGEATVEALAVLHEDFSIASQIMNDLGDVEGWAGFHAVARCNREAREEASRKPTIATIWADAGEVAIAARAEREIEHRTAVALDRLDAVAIAPHAKPILTDFFTKPLAELRRANRRMSA